ncbi:MAG: glycosyltransferase family 39 protein [Chloroflexi bacterium]|nr:glycosyltransferase family 39 protein [Chloroflexota bacterium]
MLSRLQRAARWWQDKSRLLAAILAVSVLLRAGAALYFGNEVVELPGATDQLSYHNLALRLLGGHGFSFGEPWWPMTRAGEPTAHWSFLYTLYVAAVYAVTSLSPLAARLVQAVIVGLLHPYLAYLLGKRVAGSSAGLAAAALTAVYVYFVYYGGTLMTEAFYIAGLLASLYLVLLLADAEGKGQWRWALALGLVLGATILLRQLFMLVVPFLFLWLWWVRYRRGQRLPVAATLLAGAVVAVMILPFTIWNYARFDSFVLLNTNAGYAFYMSNHPVYGTRFEPILSEQVGGYQQLIPEDVQLLDEAAMDRFFLRRGLEFVREDPGRYVLLSLSRIPVYFTFWPSAGSGMISNLSRVASFGLMWPFMLAGMVIVLLRQRAAILSHPAAPLLLFAAVYTGIHVLSWALIRYRLPVDAVMLVFAGIAAVELLQWLQGRHALRARHAHLSEI